MNNTEVQIIFMMCFCFQDSVCYLKSNVKELLLKLMSETDSDSFATVMNCSIFNAENENIFCMPLKKCFSLSESGGVSIVESDDNLLEIESAAAVLDLIKVMVFLVLHVHHRNCVFMI